MRGFGRGRSMRNYQRPGRNRFPTGDKPGSGPGGYCICPSCGYKTPHSRLRPCNQRTCPKCGDTLTKE